MKKRHIIRLSGSPPHSTFTHWPCIAQGHLLPDFWQHRLVLLIFACYISGATQRAHFMFLASLLCMTLWDPSCRVQLLSVHVYCCIVFIAVWSCHVYLAVPNVFIHFTPVGIWVFSTFGKLWICFYDRLPMMSLGEHIEVFLLSIHLGMEFVNGRIKSPFLITKALIPYDSNYAFNRPRLGNIQWWISTVNLITLLYQPYIISHRNTVICAWCILSADKVCCA